MKSGLKNKFMKFFTLIFIISCIFIPYVHADDVNPNSPDFQLVNCDGPRLPTPEMTSTASQKLGHPYRACDFNGLMSQVQHLITAMIVLGVIAAMGGFIYAGVLYLSGEQNKIKMAKSIFPKVFWGFIIMLSAWFIVYQILSWLTPAGSGFGTLLGNP